MHRAVENAFWTENLLVLGCSCDLNASVTEGLTVEYTYEISSFRLLDTFAKLQKATVIFAMLTARTGKTWRK